jgi:hypothetical protein
MADTDQAVVVADAFAAAFGFSKGIIRDILVASPPLMGDATRGRSPCTASLSCSPGSVPS